LPVFLQDHVKVNLEQNSVILSAPSEVLQKFREDVQQFDIPAAQILVDVLMVEFTDTDDRELGLSLGWSNARRGILVNPSVGELSFQSVTDLPNTFSAQLRALTEKGKARVRANPRIATVSGQKASIFIGKQRYVSTPIELPPTAGGGDFGQTRNFIDAGVRLEMTPYTGGQGEIIADLHPEISVLSALDPVTRLPTKSTRRANTVVRVKDGQTIIIGGLVQNEAQDIRTKIPILGDLPLLGPLFRTTAHSSSQTELVIFITPRTLSQTGHLPAEEEQRLRQRFLGNEGAGAAPGSPVPSGGTTPSSPAAAPAPPTTAPPR
jgi:type II secretory pathway component GspD/PulD (secretin)